jgi:hypothetical protein
MASIDWDKQYETTKGYYNAFAKLVVRSWLDPEFDKVLRANPADVMRNNGIPVPQETKISYEQLQIPARPQLTDEQLMGNASTVSAISCAGSASSFSCPGCTASCFGSGGCVSEEASAANIAVK